MHIRYVAASKSHQFMLNKSLLEAQGPITFSVWTRTYTEEEEQKIQEEGGELPKEGITFIPDVVQETQMFYFDVPKLGSYLAVPCTYESCLFEDAFDLAVKDKLECIQKRREIEELKEQKQGSKRSSHQSEGEEDEESEEVQEKPYQTKEVKYVICMDTLGQDRVLSTEQIKNVQQEINFLKESFFKSEQRVLLADINSRIKRGTAESNYLNDILSDWQKEESTIPQPEEEGLERPLEGNIQLLQLYRKRLLGMSEKLKLLKEIRIMKYHRVLQTAFYYFGITQQEINEEGTNMLEWKKAKNFINDNFFYYIKYINPLGSKLYEPQIYAKIEKLQENLNDLDVDQIEQFSMALALLYRFLSQCFTVRKQDVQIRRETVKRLREERQNAIEASEQLEKKRQGALEEARQIHEQTMEQLEEGQEKTEFDEQVFLAEFDERESNQEIVIPPEINDEIDLDLLE